jgi:GT2 family glycosyltransferase
VSVIVPVRDALPWLDAQLEALAAQDLGRPFEVVVADNGSTDGTLERLADWQRRFPGLRVLDASGRPGASGARNQAARAARAGLLAFCDADDVVGPGWLAALVAGLERADVVAGSLDTASLNGRSPATAQLPATSALGFLPAGLACNLGVRREAFWSVGGFDEGLAVGEDVDLCWRLQLSGHRFGVASGAVVAKRERAGALAQLRRGWQYGRADALLCRRYRHLGARPPWAEAARSWLWLAANLPALASPVARRSWAHGAGVRLGRLAGSARHRVLCP